jgi:large conductance mechanosensitive channel
MAEREVIVNILNEFKAFILRGNVIDLAIAVVIGAAFGAVVTALVNDLITPLIAAIGGQPDFSAISFTVHNSRFKIGDFINALVSFLIIAAVLFFLVIKPINALQARRKSGEAPPDPTTKDCPYCLSTIPIKATRCAYCTQDLTAASNV